MAVEQHDCEAVLRQVHLWLLRPVCFPFIQAGQFCPSVLWPAWSTPLLFSAPVCSTCSTPLWSTLPALLCSVPVCSTLFCQDVFDVSSPASKMQSSVSKSLLPVPDRSHPHAKWVSKFPQFNWSKKYLS
ncbi:hypothetical protein HJG60_012180 [Phyllostomus discolor]|uniref:Uncharacterized protein n=1 Tax=Phyllostomus discolor TaxID=89673 RepID=A0A833Z7W9_9CHIR|nr:hypothetical protein HJG60_012180 [Phyllostomus discolor]